MHQIIEYNTSVSNLTIFRWCRRFVAKGGWLKWNFVHWSRWLLHRAFIFHSLLTVTNQDQRSQDKLWVIYEEIRTLHFYLKFVLIMLFRRPIKVQRPNYLAQKTKLYLNLTVCVCLSWAKILWSQNINPQMKNNYQTLFHVSDYHKRKVNRILFENVDLRILGQKPIMSINAKIQVYLAYKYRNTWDYSLWTTLEWR